MRALLILCDSFPVQQALWQEVSRRDVDLHVAYTLDIPRSDVPSSPEFGTPHELSCIRVRGNRLTWMKYRGLNSLIKGLRPDLVHALNEPWSVVAQQTVHSQSRHVVMHGAENLWDRGNNLEASIRRRVTRRVLSNSSGFVSWNAAGVALAQSRGLASSKPTLVLSAVLPHLERFKHPERRRAAARKAWQFEDEFVVGYVGRLVVEKGIHWLLESWKAANLGEHARLVFVGQGPLENAIRLAAANDSRIRLVGQVSGDQIPTVMAAMDALVLPSLTTANWCEQYGRVVTEAMASGLPVIASNSGAIPEVVGDGGIIISEGSTIDFATALRRVGQDPVYRHSLCEVGLARARLSFSPAIGAERLDDFWRTVMELNTP